MRTLHVCAFRRGSNCLPSRKSRLNQNCRLVRPFTHIRLKSLASTLRSSRDLIGCCVTPQDGRRPQQRNKTAADPNNGHNPSRRNPTEYDRSAQPETKQNPRRAMHRAALTPHSSRWSSPQALLTPLADDAPLLALHVALADLVTLRSLPSAGICQMPIKG